MSARDDLVLCRSDPGATPHKGGGSCLEPPACERLALWLVDEVPLCTRHAAEALRR